MDGCIALYAADSLLAPLSVNRSQLLFIFLSYRGYRSWALTVGATRIVEAMIKGLGSYRCLVIEYQSVTGTEERKTRDI